MKIQPKTYNRVRKLTRILSVMIVLVMVLGCCAFASDAIQTGVKSGAKQIYTILTAIVVPIAAVALAFCGFQLLFGGEREIDSAKKRILVIVIVVALVLLAPVVINQVGSWFSPDYSIFG